MMNFIMKKMFGTQNERTLNKLRPTVEIINGYEAEFEKLSDEALMAKTDEFRERLKKEETLDDILPEAFAAVREASKRTTGMRHFDVQMIGGMVLHGGNIAEMVTGEGKTLVATLPVYLNAIEGKGVHVVTVNDYLAGRDRDWMAPIYEKLGLTVGSIQHNMPQDERRAAYECDITYGTNNEFGFDYLRDNMVPDVDYRVQRERNFAIVDEVDSILIDEARTPLIISGPAEDSTDKYYKAQQAMRFFNGYKIEKEEYDPEWKSKLEELKKEYDYIVDEKAKTVTLTESGEKIGAERMGVDNLHDSSTIDERHKIITAIRANQLFALDVDYVINDEEIVIVDEFTGRLMPGRRFSDGLHQALEAKEGVKIRRENQTLATVTFQNYFRMYDKLAGMTGTAATEAVEFEKIYKLEVVVIPTNKPRSREDYADCIYRTEREKFNAVAEEILEHHEQGRPVLVGTISIATSERLSNTLKKQNVAHSVLNAKYHEQEAEIISRAGQPGAITIATNMAGRGTDIVLGEGVKEKGGLCVLGTERHESRRIDNQLRGRCGRQGDPGSTKFYISLEDELMRLFGSDRISVIMQKLGMEEGEEIQHPLVSKAIENAQKRVEGRNFDIRKHLLDFDDVMNRQRELIYAERDVVLNGEGLKDHLFEMIENLLEDDLGRYAHPDWKSEDKDPAGLSETLKNTYGGDFSKIVEEHLDDIESLRNEIDKEIKRLFAVKEKELGEEKLDFLMSYIILQVIDTKWKEHLHGLDSLKEGIGLRAYGQRDPLKEYQKEAFELFEDMVASIKAESVELMFRVQSVSKDPTESALNAPKIEFVHPESQGLSQMAPEQQSSTSAGSQGGLLQGGSGQTSAATKPTPVKRTEDKVGRNDPCPCGSGKKYKKCCGS